MKNMWDRIADGVRAVTEMGLFPQSIMIADETVTELIGTAGDMFIELTYPSLIGFYPRRLFGLCVIRCHAIRQGEFLLLDGRFRVLCQSKSLEKTMKTKVNDVQ